MNPRIRTLARTMLLLVTAVSLSSCTALHPSIAPMQGAGPMPGGTRTQGASAQMRTASAPAASGHAAASARTDAGLVLHMHDASTVHFASERWELTTRGVRGRAQIHADDGSLREADTTISYWDVSSAAAGPGRGTLLSQFLLTILGVILVIGLAAIILYAAFLATDR